MILYVRSYVVLLVLLVVQWCSGQVPRDQLFPFGPSNGDTKLVIDDLRLLYESGPITLLSPFTFFNVTHSKLYVMDEGNIFFTEAGVKSFPLKCDSNYTSGHGPRIAPFWSGVDTGNGGQVCYRETSDATIISRAHDEVKRWFPDAEGLSLKSVLIVTWDNVAHYRPSHCPDDKLGNTFQAILASDSDEKKSFVIFFYHELTWTHPTRDLGSTCGPMDTYPPVAGFLADDGHPFQYVLGDCESDVLELTEKSNVDELGKWVFRVDKEIESPTYREYIKMQDRIHLSHGYGIPNSGSPIIGHIHPSTVRNQNNTNDSVHSDSSKEISSSVSYYYYAILVIFCMYV